MAENENAIRVDNRVEAVGDLHRQVRGGAKIMGSWRTVITVRSLKTFRTTCWMNWSVSRSIADVASSSTRIFDSRRMALQVAVGADAAVKIGNGPSDAEELL